MIWRKLHGHVIFDWLQHILCASYVTVCLKNIHSLLACAAVEFVQESKIILQIILLKTYYAFIAAKFTLYGWLNSSF
jgi:hypothetical protein